MADEDPPIAENEAPAPSRTPLYEALHASRYGRQDMIRGVEELTGNRVAVYFANQDHPGSSINASDIAPMNDVLLDCEPGCDLDLVLQSPGGEIDTAEKLVYMLRRRAGSFRVIVIERAKSAATLVALAADAILMGPTSELGPIDPQVTIFTADGKPLNRPARSFLDGLELIKQSVIDEGALNPAYYPLLSQLDPALLDYCQKAIGRSEQFAEKWLRKGMLKNEPDKASKIAKRLTDVKQYRSHGMVIDRDEAKSMGLNVRFLEDGEELWDKLWRLHLAYEVERYRQPSLSKIFETRRVSVPFT